MIFNFEKLHFNIKVLYGLLTRKTNQKQNSLLINHMCSVQLNNEIQAALCRGHKISCTLKPKNFISTVKVLLILCSRETLCDNYIMCSLKPKKFIYCLLCVREILCDKYIRPNISISV